MPIQLLLLVPRFYFMEWRKMIKNLEINVTTGQVNEIEMSNQDIETLTKNDAEALDAKAKAEAQKAADKSALLAKLGITAEEAKLLLS
jgi:hypothetical protein